MKNIFLLIGPRNNLKDPEITGGVIVLFEDLISYCNKHNKSYLIIDTNKANYKNKLVAYIIILFSIIVKTPKVTHISLHGTANDYVLIAPFALIMAKIFQKYFSLRKFAGNFIELYESYSYFTKLIIRKTLKNSSCNFFETKYLVNYFKKYNDNTFWFPNVRSKQNVCSDNIYRKKFIFIGAINQEKGIDVLCEVSNLLSGDYEIDLYGILYNHYTEAYFDNYNVTYKGKLKSEDVISTLIEYDVLVLPSFREGYPGIIVEALSVGLPVITTNLKGIMEMIDEKSSLLVDPENIKQLKDAIELFNEVNYKKKSIAALEQFDNFDSKIQTRLYFNKIDIK